MSLKSWDKSLKPREKALENGIESLSDSELLALIIRNGLPGQSVVYLATEILNQCGGLSGLMKLNINELLQIKGVGMAKGCEIACCLEIAKRISYQKMINSNVLDNPVCVINWLKQYIGVNKQEYFVGIFLNSKKRVIGHEVIYVGTDNMINVTTKDLFYKALKYNANGIIIAHNHPSQQVKPSFADDKTTLTFIEAGKYLNIPIYDHIIVSYDEYYSYKEHKLI